METCSEFAELYLFDKEYNVSALCQSDCHVSKDVWHNRLGHPAIQVLNLLKGTLNLNHINHEIPCEVCHKAKQSRESFPLSENKSTFFGQLVRLDVWGPYKVVSGEGFRYFLTIVDDFNRSVWVYMIKSKDEVFQMYASGKKYYKLFSLENRNILYSRDVKFYEIVFSYKMNKSSKSFVESENEVKNLNFFDYVESETTSKTPNSSPNNDEEWTLVSREGGVHQHGDVSHPGSDEQIPHPGLDSVMHQSGHDGLHSTTPAGEENQSKGNVGANLKVPVFQNAFENQIKEASQRRSSRSSKLSAKLNDYVLDSRSFEPSSYEEASKDVNWINDMNDGMHALYENDIWELTNLPAGKEPIGSFEQSKYDHSLYIKTKGDVSLYLLVYVDDLVIIGNSKLEIEKFRSF
ncbi:ribonuclease H-like domain-containing protein [Tanacetum coccineum]